MNILLVDDEEECCEIMKSLIKSLFPFSVGIHIANSGNSAIEILKQVEMDFCICDHTMPNGMGNAVLKYIIDENKKTKFVLCSTVHPSEFPTIYPAKNVFFSILKPDIFLGIENLFEEIMRDAATDLNYKSDFTPLTPNFLLHLGMTPADIYIRISNDKFIKCLNKNTPFDLSDFNKYQSKSITRLFILNDNESEKGNVEELISSAISKLINNSNLPVEARMSIAHTQISEMIKSYGMTSELADITNLKVKQTIPVIMKTKLLDNFWEELCPMGEYPSDVYALHSLLASAVVKKLRWNTEASIFKLIMAAFLQDATLSSGPLNKVYNYRHFLEIEKNLNKEEIKNFMDHPKMSREMVEFIKKLPNDIDRILQEQHEMPDGSGFPKNLNAHRLAPLSCVFILTGILARSILAEGPAFKLKNFLKKFEAEGYNNGNFKESFSAIQSLQV